MTATAIIALVLTILARMNLFNIVSSEYLITLTGDPSVTPFSTLREVMSRRRCEMRSVEISADDNIYEAVFGLKSRRKRELQQVIKELDGIKGIRKYRIFSPENEIIV